jgi:hypothetical protein
MKYYEQLPENSLSLNGFSMLITDVLIWVEDILSIFVKCDLINNNNLTFTWDRVFYMCYVIVGKILHRKAIYFVMQSFNNLKTHPFPDLLLFKFLICFKAENSLLNLFKHFGELLSLYIMYIGL